MMPKFKRKLFLGLLLFGIQSAVVFAAEFESEIQSGQIKKNLVLTEHFHLEFSDLIKNQPDADGDGFSDIVENIAYAAEESYDVIVDNLDYENPLPGDELIIVLDDTDDYLTSGVVGITSVLSDGETPYMAVDPWAGQDLLYVTMAHEFFHAVQFGYTVDFASSDQGVAMAESYAVWMEDKVYDSVNDYLGYLSDFFEYPDYSIFSAIVPQDSYFIYGLGLWPKFLTEYFDEDDILKDVWDNYIGSTLDWENNYKVYDAYHDAVEAKGEDLEDVYKEFSLWNLDVSNYEEGNFYPDLYLIEGDDSGEYTLIDETVVPTLYGSNYLYFENEDNLVDFYFHIVKSEGVSYSITVVPYKNGEFDFDKAMSERVGASDEMEEEIVLEGLYSTDAIYVVVSPLEKDFDYSKGSEEVFDEGYFYYYAADFGQSVIDGEDLTVESETTKEGEEAQASDSTRASDSLVLEIVDYNEDSVSLKWNRLTDSDIDSYEIQYGTKSGDYDEEEEIEKAYVTSSTIDLLEEDEEYFFILVALDEDGDEILDPSNEVSVTPEEWIFTDISYLHENYDAVSSLTDLGIFQGYTDGSFQPDRQINRAELLKILISGQDILPDSDKYKNCFTDVGTEWYARYVCYAKTQGWIQGYSDGSFKPSNYVNKVEALKMLLQTYGLDLNEGAKVNYLPYDDVNASAWYAIYLWKAGKLQILEEEPGNNFYPSNYRTRGEMAEELYRYLAI